MWAVVSQSVSLLVLPLCLWESAAALSRASKTRFLQRREDQRDMVSGSEVKEEDQSQRCQTGGRVLLNLLDIGFTMSIPTEVFEGRGRTNMLDQHKLDWELTLRL